jgi:hypothetical protein
VHILKELEIFPNSHTKYDQGALVAHNFYLGRCTKTLVTKYLGQSVTFRFLASKMGHGLDPV